ncbi:MAG: rhomboid family intramembrane serine protease [Chlorobi bacterium]|nr:rhomboid family intramembrane serine protease [Chlorobiota bacterium]
MDSQEKLDKQALIRSIKFPLFFIFILWLIKIYEVIFELDLHTLGVFPLRLKGLTGILTSPLIHGSFKHLISNTGPLFFLMSGLFYFYRKIALKIFIIIYLLSGLLVWLSAREAFHIGASGLIYGIAAFLFTSGIIRRDIRLSAVSLIIVFLYGGMIWGIIPMKPQISWESHLLGLVVGVVLAFVYKKESTNITTLNLEDKINQNSTNNNIIFKYYYTEKENEFPED